VRDEQERDLYGRNKATGLRVVKYPACDLRKALVFTAAAVLNRLVLTILV